MGQLIELPDITNIKMEIRQLKKSLEDLFLEKDELQFVVCENIKTAYMLEIGNLEYKVYKIYCKFMRLRRKKELIQAKKNRKEKVETEVIEKLLDEEFLEYKKKLDEKINEINHALELSKMETLSKEKVVEFKKLYKSIVKKLHPDLNPTTSEAEKQLFFNATEAYKQGDIGTLQVIFEMVGNEITDDEALMPLKTLKKEKERYQGLVNQVRGDIEKIKKTTPYIWKIYLEDGEEKAKKIAELKKELKSFEEAIRTQQEYINDLMREKK